MRYFDINLVTVLVRFYLMMAAVIVGLFTGLNWLAFLALPIFLSIMLGVTFRKEGKGKKIQCWRDGLIEAKNGSLNSNTMFTSCMIQLVSR